MYFNWCLFRPYLSLIQSRDGCFYHSTDWWHLKLLESAFTFQPFNVEMHSTAIKRQRTCTAMCLPPCFVINNMFLLHLKLSGVAVAVALIMCIQHWWWTVVIALPFSFSEDIFQNWFYDICACWVWYECVFPLFFHWRSLIWL